MGIRRNFVLLLLAAIVTGCNGCDDEDDNGEATPPDIDTALVLDRERRVSEEDGVSLGPTPLRHPAGGSTDIVKVREPEQPGGCEVNTVVVHLAPSTPAIVTKDDGTKQIELGTTPEFTYSGAGNNDPIVFRVHVIRRELHVRLKNSSRGGHETLQDERRLVLDKRGLRCDSTVRFSAEPVPNIFDFAGDDDHAKLWEALPDGANPGLVWNVQVYVVFEVNVNETILQGAYNRTFEVTLKRTAAGDWEPEDPKSVNQRVH